MKGGEIQISVGIKGYSQVSRIDFGDIFSPIARVTSIILLLSIVAAFYFEVEQMDVKTTFLHGDLEEEIYMMQPKGFMVKGRKELVCRLKNYLYGLKQSPRKWYQIFDTDIRGLGFTRSKEDHCVQEIYMKKPKGFAVKGKKEMVCKLKKSLYG